jgi:hypothetical protein
LRRTTAFQDELAIRYLPPVILALLFVVGIFVAVESYRSIDRELTAAATARRSSLAYLAATTLTEKLDRIVDVGVSLATRVRFRELVTNGHWTDAVKIMAGVPKDFPVIDQRAASPMISAASHRRNMSIGRGAIGMNSGSIANRSRHSTFSRTFEVRELVSAAIVRMSGIGLVVNIATDATGPSDTIAISGAAQ